MFAKVDVNGDDAHPLYTWLKSEKGGLLGKQDQVELHQVPRRPRRHRSSGATRPTTEPADLAGDIEKALAA